jgi:hypothetical protein
MHVPANCPLLKDLNLKLVKGPPSAPSPAPAPTFPAPASAPSPGGSAASAKGPPNGSTGSKSAPSGLMALLSRKYDRLARNMNLTRISVEQGTWMAWRMTLLPALLINLTTLLPFSHLATMLLLLLSAPQILQPAILSLRLWLCPVSFSPNTCRLSLLGCQRFYLPWFGSPFLSCGHRCNRSHVPRQVGLYFLLQDNLQPASLDG